MTDVEQYNLALYINGTLHATTTVSANTTMVDIFTVFGTTIAREKYTNYSLNVAAINSAGIGKFRESDVLGELRCLHFIDIFKLAKSRKNKLCIFLYAYNCVVRTVCLTFSPVVTRYIQEASVTPGLGMITISCITAPSVPSVICIAIYECNNGTPVTVVVSNLLTIETIQQCNVTLIVVSINNLTETLDQETYTDITPLTTPASTRTTVPSPSIFPTSKYA